MDVESPLIADGRGGGEVNFERVWSSIVDPDPEKNLGDNQEAGAVADRRFSFCFALSCDPSPCGDNDGSGLVARLYESRSWF